MTIIRLNNDYSNLYTEDSELKYKLWKNLRWRAKGCFFSPAYKARKWDGFVDFFNKTNGKFLTGLLIEVKLILDYLNVKYEIIDERKPYNFLHEKIDKNFMNDWLPKGKKPIILENFQVDLINQAIKHKRGIVKSPTASGKSFIMLGILKALPPGTPILFLGNRKGVIRQFWKQLVEWGFKNVGLVDGKTHEPNIITCAMVQSLHHIERLLPKFKVLIVDEVHMMMNTTAINAYKKLSNCYIRIAVSATPFKFTQKKKEKSSGEEDNVQKYNTKGFFGGVFTTKETEDGDLTTKYMQDMKRLSDSICTFYPISEPQIPHDIYLDAVTNGIAKSIHFHKVISGLVKTLSGRTLIIVERLSHGDALNQFIPNSLWVQGKDDNETRDMVIDQLKKSKDIVAIATKGIFNVAIDVFVHNLINGCGGKAEHDIIQLMGRGLRTAEDKHILNYFDFIFNINEYLLKHSKKRIKILQNENHKVVIKNKIDFEI